MGAVKCVCVWLRSGWKDRPVGVSIPDVEPMVAPVMWPVGVLGRSGDCDLSKLGFESELEGSE